MMRKPSSYNLRLVQLTMVEYGAKFTSLLSYVPYIWEEKEKIQCFISNFPMSMKEHM